MVGKETLKLPMDYGLTTLVTIGDGRVLFRALPWVKLYYIFRPFYLDAIRISGKKFTVEW